MVRGAAATVDISRNAELSFKASMETTSDLLLELNLERIATRMIFATPAPP